MKFRILPAVIALLCAAAIVRAEAPVGPHYNVQVRQGDDGQWQDQGVWVLGGRADARPIELRIGSGATNNGKDVVGQVKYAQKEGMLGVNLRREEGRHYRSETWKGNANKIAEGQWIIGQDEQSVRRLEARSTDDGKTLTGTLTYFGGEPLQFKATLTGQGDAPASAPATHPAKSAFDGAYDHDKIRLVIHNGGSTLVIFGEEAQPVMGKLTTITADGFEGVIDHEGQQHKLTGQRTEQGLRVSDGDDTFDLTPGLEGTYAAADNAVRFIVSLDGQHFTLEQGDQTRRGTLAPRTGDNFTGTFDDQSPLKGQRTKGGVTLDLAGKKHTLEHKPELSGPTSSTP